MDRASDMYSVSIVFWELFTITNTEMEISMETLRGQWPHIGGLVWSLTSQEPGERPGARQLLETMFSDLSVVERDRKVEVLRVTVKLQASQITKQEQLITQQNKEIEILRPGNC